MDSEPPCTSREEMDQDKQAGWARVDLASSGDESDVARHSRDAAGDYDDDWGSEEERRLDEGSAGTPWSSKRSWQREEKASSRGLQGDKKPPPWRTVGKKKDEDIVAWEEWMNAKWGWGGEVTRESSAPSEAPSGGQKKLCRDFENGDCRYGDDCKFVHGEGAAERVLAPRFQVPANVGRSAAFDTFTGAHSPSRRTSQAPISEQDDDKEKTFQSKQHRTVRVFGAMTSGHGVRLVRDTLKEAGELEHLEQGGGNAIFATFCTRRGAIEAARRFHDTCIISSGVKKTMEVRLLKGHDITRSEARSRSKGSHDRSRGRDANPVASAGGAFAGQQYHAPRCSISVNDFPGGPVGQTSPRDMSPMSRFAAGLASPSPGSRRRSPPAPGADTETLTSQHRKTEEKPAVPVEQAAHAESLAVCHKVLLASYMRSHSRSHRRVSPSEHELRATKVGSAAAVAKVGRVSRSQSSAPRRHRHRKSPRRRRAISSDSSMPKKVSGATTQQQASSPPSSPGRSPSKSRSRSRGTTVRPVPKSFAKAGLPAGQEQPQPSRGASSSPAAPVRPVPKSRALSQLKKRNSCSRQGSRRGSRSKSRRSKRSKRRRSSRVMSRSESQRIRRRKSRHRSRH